MEHWSSDYFPLHCIPMFLFVDWNVIGPCERNSLMYSNNWLIYASPASSVCIHTPCTVVDAGIPTCIYHT